MSILEHPVVHGIGSVLRRTPLIHAFLKTGAWRSLRYQIALHGERQHYTFTHFLRLPNQFEALAGPVVDHLASAGADRELEIVDIGCSTGAEPYSIASVLLRRRPALRFHIRAYDVDTAVLAQAQSARYSAKEVFENKAITAEFVDGTFDRRADAYFVKPQIARCVTFGVGDVLDPRLVEAVGKADIVLAQNLLFNFPPHLARQGFANLCTLLRSPAALFIDGVDIGMRERLTRAAGLAPLEYRIEEIHEDARRLRGSSWPWHYWGLESFDASRKDRLQRYATVFLKA